MKESQIARKLGLNGADMLDFKKYALQQDSIQVSKGFGGSILVDDGDVEALHQAWLDAKDPAGAEKRARARELERERKKREVELAKELEEERRLLEEDLKRCREIASTMPITSTASFDGYRIVEYGGYVSGDEAVMLSDSLFSSSRFDKDSVNNRIKDVRITAIDELKVAAAQLGCNAVVGLDFDYVTVDRQRPTVAGTTVNETFIILTANGTAVVVEPE